MTLQKCVASIYDKQNLKEQQYKSSSLNLMSLSCSKMWYLFILDLQGNLFPDVQTQSIKIVS